MNELAEALNSGGLSFFKRRTIVTDVGARSLAWIAMSVAWIALFVAVFMMVIMALVANDHSPESKWKLPTSADIEGLQTRVAELEDHRD